LSEVRRSLLDEYDEILLKLAMDSFANLKGKEFDLENEELKEKNEYSFSDEQNRTFSKMVNSYLKKQAFYSLIKGTSSILKKASVFIVLASIVFGLTIVNVDAARTKLLNMILRVEDEYTSIKLEKNKNGNVLNNSIYINWENAYAPTYMPDGYSIHNISNTGNMRFIEYLNESSDMNDKPIVFMQMPVEANGIVDTEDAKVTNIKIHDNDGIMIEKGERIIVIWHNDEYLFDLSGYEDKSEILKVAESVLFLK
jgi:hypothetical protein